MSNSTLGNDTSATLAEDVEILKANLNDLFMLIMGAIILFMQAGFAMLEGGAVQTKNTTNIFIKNVTDMCVGKINKQVFDSSSKKGLPGAAVV